MAKIIETKFPDLHEAQLKVAQSDARWKILCAGRRFGKTRLGVQMCLETALAGKRAWWVAPTYTIARVGWRDIQEAARSFPPEYEPTISLVNMEVTFPWCGGSIAVRSADSPHRLPARRSAASATQSRGLRRAARHEKSGDPACPHSACSHSQATDHCRRHSERPNPSRPAGTVW